MTKANIIKRATFGLTGIVTVAAMLLSSANVKAIPYSGPNTPNSPVPAFNVYTGVPSVGNESDFLRARVPTAPSGDSSTPYVDPLSAACTDGQRLQMRVYVHNGASVAGNQGGSGPSVAHGTKVKVNIPGTQAASFVPSASISATNAGTVNDTVTINCNGKVVKLSYIPGSASSFSLGTGVVPLSDAITTSGVPIRSQSVQGDVFGCWDDRVYVILSVKVVETPPEVPPSSGVCKAVDLVVLNREQREVKVTVNGEASNAQIVGYSIDFGDGTTSTNQSETHKYATDGTYIIRTSVQIKLADGTVVTRTADACNKQITFKGDQPPEIVTPPPTTPGQPELPSELPSAGAGGIIATFLGVSSVSSALYYAFVRRFDI